MLELARQRLAGWPVTLVHANFDELPAVLANLGIDRVAGVLADLGFASDQVMGREQEDFCRVACDANDAALLMQPLVGLERASGLDHFTLVRTYAVLARNYFEHDRALIALLPLATRHAGFREMLWRALVQRNYGATHVALPLGGEAESLLLSGYERELGVKLLAAPSAPGGAAAHDSHRPEVAAILLTSAPPRQRQGFCIWFTGLPSAGKSTIAEILAVMLQARGKRLTVLDGDVVRTHLSKGLGFSKEDRDTNILRIGYVASEIVHHHGVVICAAVSPYREARNRVRSLVGADNFVMVYVETPVDVCAERDVKGFYRRARAGELKGFTGVDDVFSGPGGFFQGFAPSSAPGRLVDGLGQFIHFGPGRVVGGCKLSAFDPRRSLLTLAAIVERRLFSDGELHTVLSAGRRCSVGFHGDVRDLGRARSTQGNRIPIGELTTFRAIRRTGFPPPRCFVPPWN